jgi:uncharacterized repeat protein (TIGR03803 family)
MNVRLKGIAPILLAAALFSFLVFPTAGANVVCTTLHSFGIFPEGAAPHCVLARGNDGNFYGTTFSGGSNNFGTVFQVTTNGVLASLYTFTNGLDGSSPQAGLVLGSDGSFYGTAEGGGSNNTGTIFRITTSGNFTPLYSFSAIDANGYNSDGALPEASLVQGAGGFLYGTASQGGTNGEGSVFEISTNGDFFTTLYSFTNGIDGALPTASLALGNDGYLYGTASSGGSNGYNAGTIFKVMLNSFIPLYSFTNGIDGANPPAGLALGQDGAFYGTTQYGGVGFGTVFSITAAGSFSPLYSFTNGKDGGYSVAGLIQGADLNFYGATTGSSSGFGNVFKITPAGVLTSLYSFTGKGDGANPQAGLVQNNDGTLYGTTAADGGASAAGTIFKITTNAVPLLTTLASFVGGLDGETPLAPVIEGGDGNFYGTTYYGGSSNQGVVFQMTPAGRLTVLHSFTNGVDGSEPLALDLANDGTFYGATFSGGTNSVGAVFHLVTNGAFAPTHSFTFRTEGSHPDAGLVEGNDGFFYGTAEFGGASNYGTVFKMSASGTVSVLHSFTNGLDGAYPEAGLVQGSNGFFYGTTFLAGGKGSGNVFQVNSDGSSFSTLYSFTNGVDGANPKAGLAQGNNGNFYGTTYNGGASHYGAVFEITSSGSFTALYSFTNGIDGANPVAALLSGADTNFYGTTTNGGAYGLGAVFKMSPAGALTALYSFTGGNDGNGPVAVLTQASDGSLYGTASAGGLGGMGTVFRLTGLQAVAPVLLSIVSTPPGVVLTWSTVPGQIYQLQYSSTLYPAMWSSLGNPVSASGPVASQTDLFPFTPPRFYRVSTSLPPGP